MHCPFLRKLNVKYCGLYGMKMIPLSAANAATERCLSPEYHECRLVRESNEGGAPQDHCPHLCVEDVHYCDLAPVRKLVPCNKAAASRCFGDGHRYCDLYLALAEPRAHVGSSSVGLSNAAASGDGMSTGEAEIPQPDDLAYSANHMWLDDGDDRRVHIGVDAFFTSTLGNVESVTFPARRELARPSALIRVGGLDLEMVFPLRLSEIETNSHLAGAPSTVSQDPYGRGWLFAGVPGPDGRNDPVNSERLDSEHLLRGLTARRWMQRERERLARFVHTCLDERRGSGADLATDGGAASGRLTDLLDRRTLVRLHHEFFSARNGGTPE